MIILLQTERLLLRPPHVHDHEAFYGIFSDAEVMRFGDGVQSRERVQEWLTTALRRHHQEWGFGPYAIVERTRRVVIGYCGLTFMPDVNGRPEIELGYRLARAAWGQGYATEAACAVRDYAFDTLCIPRLIALIDPQNTASIRVAEKLGMAREGEVMLEGYTHPDYVYVVRREAAENLGT
jgi:hypothetical protein